jgi:hypothetical protein
LVAFGQHLSQPLNSTEVNVTPPSVTANPVPPPVPCPPGTSPVSECYDVAVSGMTAPGDVSLSINAGAVTGVWGLPNLASNVATVTWTNALTIVAAPGTGSAAFSGTGSAVPADGPVTVDVCTDQTCSSAPTNTTPNVSVTTGNWQVTIPSLPAHTYWARATQTQGGVLITVFTGPFVVS